MEMAKYICVYVCVCVGVGEWVGHVLPPIMYACVLGKKRQSFMPCRHAKSESTLNEKQYLFFDYCILILGICFIFIMIKFYLYYE